jgi:hypothetical protein
MNMRRLIFRTEVGSSFWQPHFPETLFDKSGLTFLAVPPQAAAL